MKTIDEAKAFKLEIVFGSPGISRGDRSCEMEATEEQPEREESLESREPQEVAVGNFRVPPAQGQGLGGQVEGENGLVVLS